MKYAKIFMYVLFCLGLLVTVMAIVYQVLTFFNIISYKPIIPTISLLLVAILIGISFIMYNKLNKL